MKSQAFHPPSLFDARGFHRPPHSYLMTTIIFLFPFLFFLSRWESSTKLLPSSSFHPGHPVCLICLFAFRAYWQHWLNAIYQFDFFFVIYCLNTVIFYLNFYCYNFFFLNFTVQNIKLDFQSAPKFSSSQTDFHGKVHKGRTLTTVRPADKRDHHLQNLAVHKIEFVRYWKHVFPTDGGAMYGRKAGFWAAQYWGLEVISPGRWTGHGW